ncbi:hypothetical protein LX32DRAFT_41881 [Colletotrichum zoysiae]|uniref:Uncharacterized protein n=1 Tax=Colletotrichum zoysiae TaxID=1216348 RepID=A0AAD9HR53_9PEZI|nr:hypothetical protein LX32DRAFT_41881 [Colletotrichum zoysiae]
MYVCQEENVLNEESNNGYRHVFAAYIRAELRPFSTAARSPGESAEPPAQRCGRGTGISRALRILNRRQSLAPHASLPMSWRDDTKRLDSLRTMESHDSQEHARRKQARGNSKMPQMTRARPRAWSLLRPSMTGGWPMTNGGRPTRAEGTRTGSDPFLPLR